MLLPRFSDSFCIYRSQWLRSRSISRQRWQSNGRPSTSSSRKPSTVNPATERGQDPRENGLSRNGGNIFNTLSRPFRSYHDMQKRRPLLTQFQSSLVMYYIADLISQAITTNNFDEAGYEPVRGLRALVISAGISIPGYKWWQFLSNHFNFRSHILSLVTKVAVSQALFTPFFGTYFFGMQTLLAGGSLQDAKDRVSHAVPIAWKNSVKIWPIITSINFTFVAAQYRAVFAMLCATAWQTYLCWLNKVEENRQTEMTKISMIETTR